MLEWLTDENHPARVAARQASYDDDDRVSVDITSSKPTRVTVEIDAIAAALAVVPHHEMRWASSVAAQREKEEIEALLADKDPHIGLSPDDLILARQEGKWQCPTCGWLHTPRVISMDSDLMYTLDWLVRQPGESVGVTSRQGCDDDKVIGDRYYGKLRYWGLTKMVGQGRYQVTDLARRYAAGLESIPDSVTVLNDEVISVSDYEIDATTARNRVKSRKGKKAK